MAKHSSFLSRVHEPLLPMAEAYYERGELLRHNGWSAFQPGLDALSGFGTAAEVEEYKRLRHDYIRGKVGYDVHDPALWRQAEARAREDYQRTGDVIDLEPSALGRAIQWLAFHNKLELEQRRAAIQERVCVARQQEIAQHCKGYHRAADENRIQDRLKLYRTLMGTELSALGFALNKSLSTRGKPVFSRSLPNGWGVCWEFHDPQNFISGFRRASGEVRMTFDLRNLEAALAGEPAGPIWHNTEEFFPIYRVVSNSQPVLAVHWLPRVGDHPVGTSDDVPVDSTGIRGACNRGHQACA